MPRLVLWNARPLVGVLDRGLDPTICGRHSTWRELDPTPLSVLQRRYATGEISAAEYEQRKAVLERDKRSVSHSASGGPVAPLAGPPV